jgi:DNA-binding MarR family transcriptional regulator
MKLEDEIQIIVPFANEREKVILNLVYTYSILLDKTLDVLKKYDINDQHYNILKTLNDHYPIPASVGEIKKLMLNKRGDITRLLDKLHAMGLITRGVDPENRRVVLVTITEIGKELLREIDAKLAKQRDPKDNLTEEEAQQLNELLDKLRS